MMTGTMQVLDDERGAVRLEDVYDTDIDDLWRACTTSERLARWIATVSGELSVGETVQAVFTSTWAGPIRIEACDAPHHLLVTMHPGADDETRLEAWLMAEGSGTKLVVEERGLPADKLHFYGAGWQVHLEDLGRSVASHEAAHVSGWSEQTAAPAWLARWTELTPHYRSAAAG